MSDMKIGCIIQARTTSSRLPNKVLLELPHNSGVTVLERVVNRVRKSKRVNQVIIATTTNASDDKIEALAFDKKIKCFRGSELNVLERYYGAAKENNLDIIVRITSDCPCVDPSIIDDVINLHVSHGNHYTSNTLERTYPHGLDVEAFNFDVLAEMQSQARESFEREHVTPYIYKTHREKFILENLFARDAQRGVSIRITLDSESDYILLLTLYDYLHNPSQDFTCEDIVSFFKSKPWLLKINKDTVQKKLCTDLKEDVTD